ncbi:hypothetical protein ACHHYP_20288 [Achlya hypogyna]|uniref:Uncharacterized protein n=1 Tax=Achlya hypogyna TaxID=1202772 RepID=A0A1V9YSX2_ACHHY|nr:hypothetical protein ACHHYP_20288 [Achlya hypogyna]
MRRPAPRAVVIPSSAPPSTSGRQSTGPIVDGLVLLASVIYFVCSLAASLVYLQQLSLSTCNDLWWPGYNLTGYEAFLADVANDALQTRRNGSLDILSLGVPKRYDAPTSTTLVYPTYPRLLVLNELTSLEYAITNLRELNPTWALLMNTQWCWVDFQSQFEVAHTESRQERCRRRYASNAAVYVEAMLRNVVFDDFMDQWGGQGSAFTVAVQESLQETLAGQRWLDLTAHARATTSLEAELRYWKSEGMKSFVLQWQNIRRTALTETLDVTNAFAMKHSFTIKSVDRYPCPATSADLFWGPLNDVYMIAIANCSLVRGSRNYFSGLIDLDRLQHFAMGSAPMSASTHSW